MPVNPHPIVLSARAEQRRADFQISADHYRLGELSQQSANRWLSWLDLAAVVAVVLTLTLLLAAGSGVAEASLRPASLNLGRAEARFVTQVLDEHLLDPTAAHTVNAARL